jgi:ABC-type polysaccharide/polyol phosphate export permease
MPYDKKHLNLLRELVTLQFLMKDQSTTLGMLWSLLHPLLMLTVLFVVFEHRMGGSMDAFGAYLLVGVVHFTYFANSTTAAMHSLYNMRHLTRDTIFPKELIVLGAILSRTMDYLISLGLSLGIAFLAGVSPTWNLLMLPLLMVLTLLVVAWVSVLLSFIYLFVRDIDHLFQVVLRVLFFVTPIFYDMSFVGDGIARQLVLLNPLTHLVTFARTVILGGTLPSVPVLLAYLGGNALLLVFSIRIFRRVEPAFAEQL